MVSNGDVARKEAEIEDNIDFSKRLSIYSLNDLDKKCDDDVRCGYGSCKPDFLQRCNNPKVLLVCLGIFNFAQGYMMQGTMNAATSSLERRFSMSSLQVSMINTSYDIFCGVLILPMGVFLAYSHKPRILGLGAITISIGAFFMVLPHIIGGEYSLGKEDMIPLCNPRAANATSIICEKSLKDRQGLYITIFIIGQFLNALGGTTINLLAVPMLDENVKMKNLPLYSGINQTFNNLGPALAFLLGSRFLAMYVDIGRVNMDDINLKPVDPAWVGAYWIGFVVAGCIMLPAGLVLLCFNYETPQARINARTRICEAHAGKGVKPTEKKHRVSFSDIPKAFKLMCTNPIVMITALIAAIRLGVISGMVVFITKYIQFQYSVTPAKASLTIGALILPTSVVGMIGGGWIIRCLNLKIKGMFIFNIISEVIGIPLAFVFLVTCKEVPLAGISEPYSNTALGNSIYSDCNSNCACASHKYLPFCGVDNKVYFTACFAGCRKKVAKGVFGPCNCIDEYPFGDPNNQVVRGTCDTDCPEYYIFVVGLALYLFCNFVTVQAGQTSLLRSVPERDRTLAQAVMWTTARLLGTIPFPIILGAVFDDACRVWERKCGEKGSCWIYDGKSLSRGITAWIAAAGVISTILYCISLKLYKPPEEDTVNLYVGDKYSDEGKEERDSLDKQQEAPVSRF